MNSRNVKLIVILFIIIVGLKYLAINISMKYKIGKDIYVESRKEILNKVDFMEETLDIEKYTEEENFIIVKNMDEKVSRSLISRRNKSIEKIIRSAHKELGKPYSYGEIGPDSYDCSGFTFSLYLNSLGIELNRSSKDQIEDGSVIEKKALLPGDLVFFNTVGRDISHVGLYIGEGEMIHASFKNNKVIIDSINSNYFKPRYVTARRIIN